MENKKSSREKNLENALKEIIGVDLHPGCVSEMRRIAIEVLGKDAPTRTI